MVAPTAAIVWFFILPWWRSRKDRAVAAWLERGAPALGDGLLAWVELREDPSRAEDPALVPALVQQVAVRVDAVDLRAATPLRPARRAWGVAAAVVGVFGLTALLAPGLIGRGWAALTAVRTQALGQAEETGPLVGDLTLTLRYPAHVGRPDQLIPNSAGDFEAPKGTRVVVVATTLEPANGAAIRLGDTKISEVPLVVSDLREVRGELVVGEATDWRFALQTLDGRAQVEGQARRIRIEPDKVPEVTLKLPAEDLELEDLRAVPVVYQARDDFGLSKINIGVALAEDLENAEKIEQIGVKGPRHDGQDEVDLSIVQAQPGDRLALFVEAFDNNGVDGPQRGISVVRYITVHSPQAKHEALTEDLQRTIDLLLVALADRLEMEWRDGAPLPPRVASLQQGTGKAVEALAKVVEGMATDPLTPEEVRMALTGRLGALEKSVETERTLVEADVPGLEAAVEAAVSRVQKASDAIVDELEQAIVLVEAMVARLALEDMRALAEDLKDAKDRLKELIKEYKKHPDDAALKARITREIQRLRHRIDEMRERMAKLRQKLPEEFLNLDGMKKDDVAKGLDQTKDQLAELEKMLEEGKLDEALAALEEMEKGLDELAKSLDQDLDDLHKESNPEMQKALSELMDQTRDLMKRQEEISKETEEMAKAQQEALRKLLEEELKEKMDALRLKGAELEQAVGQINPERMSGISAEEMQHLEQRVADLQSALQRNQVLESLEMGERSLDHLDRIQRFEAGMPQDQNQQKIDQAVQLDRQIVQELNEMLQQARAQQQQQKAGDGQKSQQLGQQQQQLSEAAQRLMQRLQQQGQVMPGMGDKPMQGAQQAQQSMEEAARRLGQEQPGQARPGQQQAMEGLKGIMEGLKQANKPQRADRQNGRRQMSNEKVTIPGADQYEAPEVWRKDLLDAMKEDAPEQYRDQVKRYYEALIE